MSHIGVVSMKKVVRDIFWWPGITKSIENIGAKCEAVVNTKRNLHQIVSVCGHLLADLWKEYTLITLSTRVNMF